MSKRQLSILAVCAALYLLGLVWLLIGLPSCSLSTAELKPRGVYVDEASLQHVHVSRSFPPLHVNVTELLSSVDVGRLCKLVVEQGLACKQRHFSTNNLFEFILSPKLRPRSEDAIVFVFPVDRSSQALVSYFIYQLLSHAAQARWLSKDVIVLVEVFANEKTSDFPAVRSWLEDYHSTSSTDRSRDFSLVGHLPVLREAFAIDFTAPSTMSKNSVAWDRLLISSADAFGNRPNMDLLSVLLLDRDVLRRQPFITTSELSSQIRRWLRPVEVFVLSLTHDREQMLQVEAYFERLSYLLAEIGDVVRTRLARGAHGLFLERNIDALTLRPYSAHVSADLEPGTKLRVSLSDVFTIAGKLLRASSSLEEQLHHAQDIYVMMGPLHFASMAECLSALAVLASPLLVVFVTVRKKRAKTSEVSSLRLIDVCSFGVLGVVLLVCFFAMQCYAAAVLLSVVVVPVTVLLAFAVC